MSVKTKTLMDYMPCPFCTGEFAPMEVVDGDGIVEEGSVALGHTMPYCAEYEVMDPDVYLRAVREKLEKKRPAGNN